MLVSRVSPITDKLNTLDLFITEHQMYRYVNDKLSAEEAFINLTPEEIEYVKTGLTLEEQSSSKK